MFDIGLLELLIVTVVALVVLGPDKIPGAVRSGAKTIFWFKRQAADAKKELKATGNTEAASYVGKVIANKAKDIGVKEVAFDRSGFLYHGRIKALAEAAREAGLKF